MSFDAVGTLIRVAEPVGMTYARVAADCGHRLDPLRLDSAFREIWRAAAPPRYRPDARPPDKVERDWWHERVAEVVRASGGEGLAEDRSAFAAFFDRLYASYAAPGAWVAYPEAHRVLEALRSQGLKLLVVSNFDHRLIPVLDGLGLAGFFDDIVISGSCGAWKPDQAIFQAAAERAGTEPGRILHVGDDPVADVAGADRAGFQTHRVDRPDHDLTGVPGRVAGNGKKRIADHPDPS